MTRHLGLAGLLGLMLLLPGCELARGFGASEPAGPVFRDAATQLRLLQSGSQREQILAARLLGNAGDRRAIRPLMSKLTTSEPPVQVAAARALGRLQAREAVDVLGRTLGASDEALVRGASADALGAIADPRAIASLIEALEDPHPYVRRDAADALAAIGRPAIEGLDTVLHEGSRRAKEGAIRALAAMDDPEADRVLDSILTAEGSGAELLADDTAEETP